MQTRPTNLALTAMHQGVFTNATACAYIYYAYAGNETHVDNKGKPLSSLIDSEEIASFDKHLRAVVAPVISKGLEKTNFEYKEMDYLDGAMHPHFVITRKDGKALQADDLAEIKKCLTDIIEKTNKYNQAKATVATSDLYVQETRRPAQKEEKKGYNLRQRH